MEIADSSIATDRGAKAILYTFALIPYYWIVNLNTRMVEVYSDPTGPGDVQPHYRERVDVYADGTINLILDGIKAPPIAVRDLLP